MEDPRYVITDGPQGHEVVLDTDTDRIIDDADPGLLQALTWIDTSRSDDDDMDRYRSATRLVSRAETILREARLQQSEAVAAVYQRVGSMRAAAAELGLSLSKTQQMVSQAPQASRGDRVESSAAPRGAGSIQGRDAETDQMILDDLAAGRSYAYIRDRYGRAPQALTGRARWDREWSRRFDAATMQGRNPAWHHGTSGAYRRGCRCPECRRTHESSR